ncbi:alpha/beta hydrolase fold protein [Pseudarthrobacter chlorophenolicus A6]|uniref:Alpha/beta hydrolase fold protein n=1 Tax=Pseudarthrobacter chlorophenolicus (strain ATCC 700700 / DSM 12829 / CIP 107037 / JCM 12360 / KCTC 9906 / NCIMB 13794 / A6) TaxID=452863 RepID=B8H9U4_PSECP|nr:alpha/beta hydrolase [Pseudarthrobacter chlorophenolicus]ACL38328.1 alpha/beta hydrolase fold protein [Pseudarthrobacter chlorophenolicus A6]SDQ50907.1 Pimeloyl-ACP methyl ester carboxylesterase [Pseudarthrobacter chlorophenolicus]
MKEQVLPTHDGGRLALYSYGTEDAPGEKRVVLIGGAFLTALIYRPFSIALAKGLGEGWAVDVYDRRGRGSSSPQPPGYSMATEIEDVRTVMDATGARNILGHSLGGSVALNAVQEFTGTGYVPDKLAVYDAAVNIDGSIDIKWLDGFEKAVNDGKVGHALAHMKKATSPGSAMARIPEPVLAGLMAVLSRTKVNKVFRQVMPSGVGELRAAYNEKDHARDFSVLPAGTHFMAGGKSPSYYKVTAQRLHAAVPGSTFELSPKCFHGSIPAAVKELVADISAYFTA